MKTYRWSGSYNSYRLDERHGGCVHQRGIDMLLNLQIGTLEVFSYHKKILFIGG